MRVRGRQVDPPASDGGSITPMVLGMALCLLVLIAGITATGSVFLARQNLQNRCDGAALAAADGAGPAGYVTDTTGATRAAADYLRIRDDHVHAVVSVYRDRAAAQCSTTAIITLGWMFDVGTTDIQVTSTSYLRFAHTAAG